MTVILEQGDVEERLRELPDASFDALLSDCPYGIGVSSWDGEVPGRGVWQEAARVLAPGAWLLAFGAPRTHHHLMVEMEEAGLEIRDVFSWLYATGFPKGGGLKPAWEPVILARAPGRNLPLQIDSCRTKGTVLPSDRRQSPRGRKTAWGTYGKPRSGDRHHPDGRWPANILFSHHEGCSEERCLADCPVEILEGQASDASRFFFCPKPAGREAEGNDHPCRKPLSLTTYLARLILREGGRLLIPYSGSGSEILGALRAGWREILAIEKEKRWIQVTRERLRREEGFSESYYFKRACTEGGHDVHTP